MRRKLLLLLSVAVLLKINAQSNMNPIVTAAPFLLVASDAKSGGMGDVGVATSSDANALFWNSSKYAFMENSMKISLLYTPWLRNIVDDVFLGGFVIADKIDERSAWALGLRYFNLGNIELTNFAGVPEGTEKMNEFSLDGSYSLKLSKYYSMGITIRYIRSDLGIESANSAIQSINTFSSDVSGFYESSAKNYGAFGGVWRAGFSLSNLGPRVSYTDNDNYNYLPTNMRIGGGFEFIFDHLNSLQCYLDFNKLLVPTPNVSLNKNDKPPYKQGNTPFFEGVFKSFSDAPGGFSEELKEITWGLGFEYLYKQIFALRTGYFHESEMKGTRNFFTLGTGFSYKNTDLDISYLFNTSSVANPLENTLRFSLSFTFDKSVTATPVN